MSGRAAVPAAAGAHACGGGQPAGYGQPAGCLSAWTLPPFPVIGPAAVPTQPGPVHPVWLHGRRPSSCDGSARPYAPVVSSWKAPCRPCRRRPHLRAVQASHEPCRGRQAAEEP
eukprot:scaffold63679_cov27-Phaeocystis_antarctica.AAC.1